MTTIGTILAADLPALTARAGQVLGSTKAVVDLPPMTRKAVLDQAGAPFAELHRMSVGDLLKFAWSNGKAFRKAAQESVRANAPQQVFLNGFHVPCEYRSEIEVTVGGHRIAAVGLSVLVEMELLGFAGHVVRGRLMQMSTESMTATASIAIAGHPVASRSATLNLLIELPLPSDGLPLLRDL